MTKTEAKSTTRRSLIELVCVILTGVAHITLELCCDGMAGAAERLNRPQHFFNLAAVVGWGAYLVWCFVSRAVTVGEVGFRKNGFWKSMGLGMLLVIPGAAAMCAIGFKSGMVSGVTAGFWVLLPVYPLWGLAQQFALQILVARNLRAFIERPGLLALTTGAIFSTAHFPTYMLMALTFPAGVIITWIFAKHRNLWAAGVLHGILGACAYYFMLGQDPGTELLSWLSKAIN